MKKLGILVMALVLVVGMSVGVMAESPSGNEYDFDTYGKNSNRDHGNPGDKLEASDNFYINLKIDPWLRLTTPNVDEALEMKIEEYKFGDYVDIETQVKGNTSFDYTVEWKNGVTNTGGNDLDWYIDMALNKDNLTEPGGGGMSNLPGGLTSSTTSTRNMEQQSDIGSTNIWVRGFVVANADVLAYDEVGTENEIILTVSSN